MGGVDGQLVTNEWGRGGVSLRTGPAYGGSHSQVIWLLFRPLAARIPLAAEKPSNADLRPLPCSLGCPPLPRMTGLRPLSYLLKNPNLSFFPSPRNYASVWAVLLKTHTDRNIRCRNILLNNAEKETKLHVSPFIPHPLLALNSLISNTVINIINL